MDNYELLYGKIVGEETPPKYSNPEEQGNAIRKCTILQNVEIEYNTSKSIKTSRSISQEQ